jgi:hypothetical protein
MAKYLANGTYVVKRVVRVVMVSVSVPATESNNRRVLWLTVRSYLNEQSSPP